MRSSGGQVNFWARQGSGKSNLLHQTLPEPWAQKGVGAHPWPGGSRCHRFFGLRHGERQPEDLGKPCRVGVGVAGESVTISRLRSKANAAKIIISDPKAGGFFCAAADVDPLFMGPPTKTRHAPRISINSGL